MPRGPKGEKRPADVIGAAVKVMKIATGEVPEDANVGGLRHWMPRPGITAVIDPEPLKSAAAELGRRGGKARAASLSKKAAGGNCQPCRKEALEEQLAHDRVTFLDHK